MCAKEVKKNEGEKNKKETKTKKNRIVPLAEGQRSVSRKKK